MGGVRVYSPVPDEPHARQRLAPRPQALTGLRVGLLGNLKPNCDVVLLTVRELLLDAGVEDTLSREKTSCSLGAPAGMLDEIATWCQAAVVALGD